MNYTSKRTAFCLSGALALVTAAQADVLPGMVAFEMPVAGHATLAINDSNGIRVRNLLADLPFSNGVHTVEWDGRDDAGNLLPPGDYRWTGLYRDAIHAVYQGSFQHGTPPWKYGETGGWVADHSAPSSVVALGNRVLLGSPEAEWGHGLIASDMEGRKQWGIRWLNRRSWCGADALAAVGNRVFASSYPNENAVWEVDPATGDNHLVLELGAIPEALRSRTPWKPGLPATGLRVVGGKAAGPGDKEGLLFVADIYGQDPRTHVFGLDAEASSPPRLLRTLPLRAWSMAWLPDGRCVALSDGALVQLDIGTGATIPLAGGLSSPWGVATDAKGRIYVSEQGGGGEYRYTPHGQLSWRYLRVDNPAVHQIKIFSADGTLLRAMGQAGGRRAGRLDPQDFRQPAGLAIDLDGRLWVTEFSQAPKRVTVWNIPEDPARETPTLAREFLGPCMYGGGAFAADPAIPWRITDSDYGVVFDVNLDTRDFRAVALPWLDYSVWKDHGHRPDLPFCGRPGIAFPLEGRRFAACRGGYGHGAEARWQPYRFNATGPVMIGEYRGDVFVPLAAVGNIRTWMRDRELNCRREEQWLPPALLEAARGLPDWKSHAAHMGMDPDAPDVPHVVHVRGSSDWIVHPWPEAISGFLWVDTDGDARMQPGEISFHPFKDCYDITLDSGLNIYQALDHRAGGGVFKLPFTGFNKVGAPRYRWADLEQVCDAEVELAHVGGDGSLLEPTGLRTASGKRIWSYPSDPRGARALGAEKRKLLKPGAIFRPASLRGVVPGPGTLGNVYMLHSMDGMNYLLTRDDGLFITTVFRPFAYASDWDEIPQAERGMLLDAYSLQDECFNGSFLRAEATGQGFESGRYYMLGLGRAAVVELTGLESVHRFTGGTVSLVEGAGHYGRGYRHDPGATAAGLDVIPLPRAPMVARRVRPGVDTFSAPHAEFASATVRAAWDQRGLHLKWEVSGDATPFINRGQDWTQIFATGDGCEIQYASPTLGTCRLIFAMHNDLPVAVRLRYGGAIDIECESVTYRSDVAETVVPAVELLPVDFHPRRQDRGYVLQMTVSWEQLGIVPTPGMRIPFELGLLYSDPSGTRTMAREYWNSGSSGMVSDLPTEARPTDNWGVLELHD